MNFIMGICKLMNRVRDYVLGYKPSARFIIKF